MLNSQNIKSLLLEPGESLYLPPGAREYDFADDNGYAYHKLAAWVINEKGEKRISTACIPSRAQIGRVNVSSSGSSVGLFEIDETYYTVGESVPDPERIRGPSYATSELNNVLVANSIMAAGFGGNPVRLCTGLPLKQYFNEDATVNHNLIDKIRRSLSPLAIPFGVSEANRPTINSHLVMAESLSAFAHWFLDDDGQQVNHVRHGVLVVDIGGGTSDISSITPANDIYIDGSDTKRIGILDLFKKLRSLLSDAYEVDSEHIREDMLDHAVRTSEFLVRGNVVDCSNEVKKAKNYVAKRLSTYVNELVTDTVDRIIFVGGGAEVLRDELLSLEDYADGFVVIPDRPQFANVLGMLKLMTYVFLAPSEDITRQEVA